MDEVKPIKVPRYQELSVKALYQQAIEDEALNKYFPNIDGKNKPIDREYFFNILNTIYPEFVQQLIEHAQNQRYAPELNETKKEYILISDDWYSKLMKFPFISKKPGKTIQLLKESTKILKGRRQNKQLEIGMTLKRFKGMENEQSQNLHKDIHQQNQINDIYEDYEQSENQSPQRQQMFQI